MFRFLIGTILGVFLLVIVGSVILEVFPQLQPLWDEFKRVVVDLYNASNVKYGTIATALIILAIILLVATSSSGRGKF
jgi:hypothetical protein